MRLMYLMPIPINQPGVGDTYLHESGIHADGALKNHRNYELYDFSVNLKRSQR